MTPEDRQRVDLKGLVDAEDRVYVFGVNEDLSARFMERIKDRFDALFDHARVVVVAADIDGDLAVHALDPDVSHAWLEDLDVDGHTTLDDVQDAIRDTYEEGDDGAS